MAWSATGGFRQYFIDGHRGVNAPNLDLETHKGALFNNSVTPDFDAVAASIAYNTGTWVTANEVSGTGYTAAGQLLANTTVTGVAGGIEMFDADDMSWTGATLSNVYGVLLYHDALTTPVADEAFIAVYFGGAFAVTAGTFTVQWSASGIARIDYA